MRRTHCGVAGQDTLALRHALQLPFGALPPDLGGSRAFGRYHSLQAKPLAVKPSPTKLQPVQPGRSAIFLLCRLGAREDADLATG